MSVVKEYYDDLWQRLPDRLAPPDLSLRGNFLLAHVAAGQRILDLGCGDGVFSELIVEHAGADNITLVGAEVSAVALERARARARIPDSVTFTHVPFDGDLPLGDNGFDLVWASEVIEHVADTGRWLSEVRRVMAPGATLLVTTPNHSRLRLAIGGAGVYSPPLGDHLHLYDRRSLTTLLEEFGFGSVEVSARHPRGPFAALLLAHAQR